MSATGAHQIERGHAAYTLCAARNRQLMDCQIADEQLCNDGRSCLRSALVEVATIDDDFVR